MITHNTFIKDASLEPSHSSILEPCSVLLSIGLRLSGSHNGLSGSHRIGIQREFPLRLAVSGRDRRRCKWESPRTAISENASRNPLPANRPTATELAAKTNSVEHSHTTRTTPVQQVSRRLPDLGSMTPRTPRMWGTNHHTFPLRAGICSLAVAGVNFQFKFSDVQICMSGLS